MAKIRQVKLKGGKVRYRVSVHMGCHVTRTKSPLRSYTADTKTECRKWVTKMESLRNDGGVLASDKSTVREFLIWWLKPVLVPLQPVSPRLTQT